MLKILNKTIILISIFVISTSVTDAGIKDCLSAILNTFTRTPPAVNFSNQKLSDAQLKNLIKFSNKNKRPLKDGDIIEVVGTDNIWEGQIAKSYPFTQHIYKNTDLEKIVIEESMIDIKPREVMAIFLEDSSGNLYDTKIRSYGDSKNVDFTNAEFDLYHKSRGNLGGINKVIIVHSHPTYVVKVHREFSIDVRANELTREDFSAAAGLASRIPLGKTVEIRATVPNGFYYSAEIATGKH